MLHTVPGFARIGEENAFAVLARATELQRQGRDIINLGIGQPDFPTPPHIVEAAIKALRDGHHGYTPATGILALREAIAADYGRRYGVDVSPDLVMVMPGGKVTMFAAIMMFGEPGRRHPLSRSRFPDLSLDDRIYRRARRAGAGPRGERFRLFRRRDAGADHAADAVADLEFAGQSDRRRHPESARSTNSSPASPASPTSRSCPTKSMRR